MTFDCSEIQSPSQSGKVICVYTLSWILTTMLSLLMGGGGVIPVLSVNVITASGFYRFFPKDILKLYEIVTNLQEGTAFTKKLSFSFWWFRQENQKLKELVTGGATGATTSSAAPSDTEASEAKEEPVKEESAAVRPKMEATTPQRVA